MDVDEETKEQALRALTNLCKNGIIINFVFAALTYLTLRGMQVHHDSERTGGFGY